MIRCVLLILGCFVYVCLNLAFTFAFFVWIVLCVCSLGVCFRFVFGLFLFAFWVGLQWWGCCLGCFVLLGCLMCFVVLMNAYVTWYVCWLFALDTGVLDVICFLWVLMFVFCLLTDFGILRGFGLKCNNFNFWVFILDCLFYFAVYWFLWVSY